MINFNDWYFIPWKSETEKRDGQDKMLLDLHNDNERYIDSVYRVVLLIAEETEKKINQSEYGARVAVTLLAVVWFVTTIGLVILILWK